MKGAPGAVQIFGGHGYTRRFPAERYTRDDKTRQIHESTYQLQPLIIAKALLEGR